MVESSADREESNLRMEIMCCNPVAASSSFLHSLEERCQEERIQMMRYHATTTRMHTEFTELYSSFSTKEALSLYSQLTTEFRGMLFALL